MLNLDELKASAINPEVAKEAYLQAEKRLSDMLDTKKTTEQKASSFFSAYLTVSLALFGIGGAIFKDYGGSPKTLPFFAAGIIFALGALMFMLALKDEDYGFLGSTPDMWLNKGTIDGEATSLGAMYAYLTHHHAKRIAASRDSNSIKIRFVRLGMLAGLCATAVFAIALILVGLV
jgi:hypothetical protein